MDFGFTKEEELWRWALKDFADRELAPKELTRFDHVFRNILKKMGELGFLSLNIPEEYGGNPGNWVMLGIMAEEIARINIPVAYSIMISYEVGLTLASYGTDEAKKEWLAALVNGNKLGCISITEPNAGTDFTAITATAVKNGDSYIVSGEKVPVSFGMEADITLSFVKTGPEEKKEVTAMLIPLNLSGISRSPVNNMGLVPTAPASLRFDGVKIPVKYRIGAEGEGFFVNATTCLLSDLNRIITGLISLGAAQAALSLAMRYSKERFAFGKPIGQFEALSNNIAEDATLIEAGRWLCYRALSLKDQGLSHTKEAAMCGWWCPKIAYRTVQDSLLIHGHAGYCDDHPFQQMLRDVVAFELISGTEQLLKLIISRETMGPAAIPDNVSELIGPLLDHTDFGVEN